MSGGYFNYRQHHISDIAYDIDEVVRQNDSTELNEWGDQIGRHLPPDVIDTFRDAVSKLREAYIYAHRIDWLLSGDDGVIDFHDRLRKEVFDLYENGGKQ